MTLWCVSAVKSDRWLAPAAEQMLVWGPNKWMWRGSECLSWVCGVHYQEGSALGPTIDVQKHSLKFTVRGGGPCILLVSKDTQHPKSTIQQRNRGATGWKAETEREDESEESRVQGGWLRGEKKRWIGSRLRPLFGCKLELINILPASEAASSICIDKNGTSGSDTEKQGGR